MQWGIVSAGCALLGLGFHALSEWQNAKTRAAFSELKVDIIDRLNKESERSREIVTPLGAEQAAMGARLNVVETAVDRLTWTPRP